MGVMNRTLGEKLSISNHLLQLSIATHGKKMHT